MYSDQKIIEMALNQMRDMRKMVLNSPAHFGHPDGPSLEEIDRAICAATKPRYRCERCGRYVNVLHDKIEHASRYLQIGGRQIDMHGHFEFDLNVCDDCVAAFMQGFLTVWARARRDVRPTGEIE